MTIESSTRTHGHRVAIEPQNNLKTDRCSHPWREYVESGGNYIRREYNWDKSYRI